VYATNRLPFSVMTVVLRMSVWLGMSFATMSAIVGWQLLYQQNSSPALKNEALSTDVRESVKILTLISCGGMVAAVTAAVCFLLVCVPSSGSWVFTPQMIPYLLMFVLGLVAVVMGWRSQMLVRGYNPLGMATANIGTLLCLLSGSVIREGIRIHAID